MEETVWLYIGVVASIILLAIITSIISGHHSHSKAEQLFSAISFLSSEADIVCKSPRGEQLSISINVPSESLIYVRRNSICGAIDKKIKCSPTDCVIPAGVILNLTGASSLFDSREYECVFKNDDTLIISCNG